jgi:hypothetical protein
MDYTNQTMMLPLARWMKLEERSRRQSFVKQQLRIEKETYHCSAQCTVSRYAFIPFVRALNTSITLR